MLKKTLNCILLVVMALVPAWFVARGGFSFVLSGWESTVREEMPAKHELQQLALDILLASGKREQNGIFISEEGLMRDIDQPNQMLISQNAKAISDFERRLSDISERKHTYVAVLPTAAGVLQQNLPRFAQSEMVDQQRMIELIYNQLSVRVRTVDAYFALRQNRDQYIYYRTDNSMTALGGYYAYTAIAKRLDIRVDQLDRFEIEYVENEYYGDLYQQPAGTVGAWGGTTAPYRKVQPDIISLFHYSGNREYLLNRRDSDERWLYHTLYPRQRMTLGAPLDVYLGGNAAFTEIQNSSTASGRLLVFGDKTALSFLPFLANHYRQVTFVNLYYATDEAIADIRPDTFDQILFAYGIESFIHTRQPARVSHIEWRADD